MRLNTTGDLGRSTSLSQSYHRTKARLDTLLQEASTGQHSDIAAAAGGDTRPLAGVETRLRRLAGYDQSATEMALQLDTAQQAMDGMRALVKGAGPALMSVPDSPGAIDLAVVSAETDLRAALGFLNTDAGGLFVFAGSRTNAPPVADFETLMSGVKAAISGLTTTDAIVGAVSDYFDGPVGSGGYRDGGYLGSPDSSGAVPIGNGVEASNPLNATSAEIIGMLKGLTLAVVAKDGIVGDDGTRRSDLARSAGAALLNADNDLVAAAARLGAVQEGVSSIQARNGAERSALEISQSKLVRVDHYATATAVSETQSMLETLYALTARLSRMSLADRL